MSKIRVFAIVRAERAHRYEQEFSGARWIHAQIISSIALSSPKIAESDPQILVMDQSLDGAFAYINSFRQQHPNIAIILVDEDADFALPGAADDITTTPFKEGDLLRRIRRLLANRQMETLRADAMPPVRELNKRLRNAVGEHAKAHEAVNACLELGYVYAALYRLNLRDPIQVNLIAQAGDKQVQQLAPLQADDAQAVGWVAKTGQSRLLHVEDTPGHPLLSPEYFGAAAVVPVGVTNRYGALFAAKASSDAIQQQDLLMLELIAGQLAAALAKES
ncbi:MAG: GAF domain-containing protein [Anaerolineae bacterium]|nr:GAF domain-containing protein [Anaerolineae bacterium]